MSKLLVGATVVIALLLGLVIFQFQHGRSKAQRAATELEAADLRYHGEIVAHDSTKGELKTLAEKMLAKDTALSEALKKLSDELGKPPKIIYVIKGATDPTTAHGLPRADNDHDGTPDPDESPSKLPSPAEVARLRENDLPHVATLHQSKLPACLLAEGDTGEIRVSQVIVETKEKNQVLVGTAECWRLKPGPVSPILTGKFSAKTTFEKEAAPSPPGVGYGVWIGVGNSGGLLGAAVAAPPFKLWSLQLDATIGGGLNLSGGWGASATVIAR